MNEQLNQIAKEHDELHDSLLAAATFEEGHTMENSKGETGPAIHVTIPDSFIQHRGDYIFPADIGRSEAIYTILHFHQTPLDD